jgi:membrane AbrB-like protein
LIPVAKVRPVAAGLIVATAGGALFAAIGTPLPWMMGSILAVAIAQMAGARLEPIPGGRDVGLVIIGVNLGLYFTPPVVAEVAGYGGYFVALGFAALGIGAISAAVLERAAGVDHATAFFGSMPGGAAEMAMMGERYGALTDRVAFSHSTRMLLVVTLFPTAITYAGFSATEDYRPVGIAFDWIGFAVLMGLAAAGGAIARRLRMPTAYMMGPLIVTIALTVSEVRLSSVPPVLTNAAQVLLGCVLGSKFERSFLAAAPRFVAALIPAVAVTLGLAAIVGWAIAKLSGAYLGTALLAAAPGGIAEMSITAKVLRIGVAFVTAAHIIRYAIVVLFATIAFKLIARRRLK